METLTELHPQIHHGGVLVVEDSEFQRRNLVDILRALGVSKIYEAGDGLAGLKLVHSLYQPPALIVLDLEMPGMDGIEMAQQMAAEGLRPSLLLASAADASILASVEIMLDALDLPVLGIMQKPLSPEHLEEAIARYKTLNTPNGQARAAPDARVSVDALVAALDAGRIVPFYQPKVLLESAEITGLEALARWREPDGGMIPPGDFIDLAEKHGLIDRLTLHMLDAVLRDLAQWHLEGCYPTVALNISARSLSSREFPNEIIRRVERARISPSALVLEITESALVSDVAASMGALGRLRLKGFGLSIDDYGTGFSSMQQLSRLPFTELKIDRSFVCRAHEKRNLRVMLESAIQMGHRLGLTTVAEGIETIDELLLLQSLGCKYAQGYLIAKPMPGHDLIDWMRREQKRISALCRIHPETAGSEAL